MFCFALQLAWTSLRTVLLYTMDALRKLRRSRGSHKSHLGKLLENIDTLLEKYPRHRVLESEDTICLKEYLRQLEQKATTLSEIDKKILDTLEDEHEFESMIVESEELQSSLSQKMALIDDKLTVSPQPINTSTTSDSSSHQDFRDNRSEFTHKHS